MLVRNDDAFVDDITVPPLDVATTGQPGGEVARGAVGTRRRYTIYCPLHADMDEDDPITAVMTASDRRLIHP